MSEPRYLVYDIETIPTSESASEWTPDPGIAIAKQFPPIHVHRIVALGMVLLDGAMQYVASTSLVAVRPTLERELVETWSEWACPDPTESPRKLVDYNGRGFDVPVLQTRAMRYAIALPWLFGKMPDNRGQISSYSKEYRDRYSGHHLDLCELYTAQGSFKSQPLSALCKLIGLPGKDGMDGSQVHARWIAEEYDEILAYVTEDTFSTALLFMRIALLQGKIDKDKFRAAVESLIPRIEAKAPNLAFKVDRARLLGD